VVAQGDGRSARSSESLALEITAAARGSARLWLAATERALRSAEEGGAVDVDGYDQQFLGLLTEMIGAVHRLAATGVPLTPDERAGQQPVLDRLTRTALQVRGELLRLTDGAPAAHARSVLMDRALRAHEEADALLARQAGAITRASAPHWAVRGG